LLAPLASNFDNIEECLDEPWQTDSRQSRISRGPKGLQDKKSKIYYQTLKSLRDGQPRSVPHAIKKDDSGEQKRNGRLEGLEVQKFSDALKRHLMFSKPT
jgi:hypothetical protein